MAKKVSDLGRDSRPSPLVMHDKAKRFHEAQYGNKPKQQSLQIYQQLKEYMSKDIDGDNIPLLIFSIWNAVFIEKREN